MTQGIYLYYDNQKDYVVYVGKDTHIHERRRDTDHHKPSQYDNQQINRVIQNNPERYLYVKFAEGQYNNEELINMEKQTVKLFKTYYYEYSTKEKPVFNFTKGGDGMSGYKHSQESKEKMSKIHAGKNFSEEHRMKLSKSHTGKKISEETRMKISKAMSGENNHNYGKKMSDEQRMKISNTLKGKMAGENNPNYGKKLSEKHRKKISEANKGKTLSEEHKRKLSAIRNTSGYYRVSKQNSNTCKHGFRYVYSYRENGKQKQITSVNLLELEEKVKDKCLPWYKIE